MRTFLRCYRHPQTTQTYARRFGSCCTHTHTHTHLVDDLKAEGDGLLAEDHLSGLGRRHDLPGVLIGGGADHHGLHLGVVDELSTQSKQSKQSKRGAGGLGRGGGGACIVGKGRETERRCLEG